MHDPTEDADEEVLSQSGSRPLIVALTICALIAGGVALWRTTNGGGGKHAAVASSTVPRSASAALPSSIAAPQGSFTALPPQPVAGRTVAMRNILDTVTDHYPGARILVVAVNIANGQVTQIDARASSDRITITLRPQRPGDVPETDEADIGAHPSVDVSAPRGRVLVHVRVVGTATHPPATQPAQLLATDDRLLNT